MVLMTRSYIDQINFTLLIGQPYPTEVVDLDGGSRSVEARADEVSIYMTSNFPRSLDNRPVQNCAKPLVDAYFSSKVILYSDPAIKLQEQFWTEERDANNKWNFN